MNDKKMYRYRINDGDAGGCVIAASEEKAKEKVREVYSVYADGELADGIIDIWVEEETGDPDVIETYP